MAQKQRTKRQRRSDPAVRNARERAKEAWKQTGKSVVRGSKHAARADLMQTAKEAPTFVGAFFKALFMTAVALARMSYSVMR